MTGVPEFVEVRSGATGLAIWTCSGGATPGGGCGGTAPVLAPASPSSVGPGCTFHPDATNAAAWIVVPLGIDPSGAAATSLTVPYFPLLAGLPVTAQAVVIDLAAALGFTLTNGVAATLGY